MPAELGDLLQIRDYYADLEKSCVIAQRLPMVWTTELEPGSVGLYIGQASPFFQKVGNQTQTGVPVRF